MKHVFVCFIFFFAVMLLGCKVEEVRPPNVSEPPRMLVSKFYDQQREFVFEFTYDGSNRLVRWQGFGIFERRPDLLNSGTYEYENNAIKRTHYTNTFYSTRNTRQMEFHINADGKVDSFNDWGSLSNHGCKLALDETGRVLSYKYFTYGFNQWWHLAYANSRNALALSSDNAIFSFTFDQKRRPDWGLPPIYDLHSPFVKYFSGNEENCYALVASSNNVIQNLRGSGSWQYVYNAMQYPDTIRYFRSGILNSVWIFEYVPAN